MEVSIMERHLTAVASLQIGFSIFGLVFVTIITFILAGLGVVIDDPEAMYIIGTVLGGLGILVATLCILGIIGGFGLFTRSNWARILVLILSAIDLLNFPIGTALGVYTIWVLVQVETVALFEKST
jgi:O-antigen/teichoic acid export membrane protein